MMVRIAEALRTPIRDGQVRSIRWEPTDDGGRYVLDAWLLEHVDTADPRTISQRGGGWTIIALTSISWLLPVELTPDGLERVAIHYDKAITPQFSFQCYGVEDARISKIGDRYLMTTCSVSPERQSATLYSSVNGLDWTFEDILLDHQNKDMLIFEGLVGGQYWAQTRPLGHLYFAYPPGSEWRAGPSINLATSPDALHWKPHREPGLRPHAGTVATARMGAGAPPILTHDGWLDAVARCRAKGDRRDISHVLDAARPAKPVDRATGRGRATDRGQSRIDQADRASDVPARCGVHDRHCRW